MNIFYIGYIRIPTEKAHGFQIVKMCEAFAQNGHDVQFIVPKQVNKITDDLFEYYNVTPSARFRFNSVDVGHFNNYTNFLRYPKSIVSLARFTLSLPYGSFPSDALIYTRNATIAWMCKWKRPDLRVVYEAHRVPTRFFFIHHFLLRRIALLVAITQGVKDGYLRRGFRNAPILVEADAVDISMFKFKKDRVALREELSLPKDTQIVLYAGSLSLYSWKGVDVLIDAARLLPAHVQVYLLGGSSEEIMRLSSTVDPNRVVLLPRVSRAMVVKYLCAADVLVLPNTKGDIMSERYTSPLKLFEYMASGTPIVASSLPSIREVLDETNATLVMPNNSAELADGVLKTLGDSRATFDRACRAKEKVHFHTWSLRAKRILDALS